MIGKERTPTPRSSASFRAEEPVGTLNPRITPLAAAAKRTSESEIGPMLLRRKLIPFPPASKLASGTSTASREPWVSARRTTLRLVVGSAGGLTGWLVTAFGETTPEVGADRRGTRAPTGGTSEKTSTCTGIPGPASEMR